MHDNDACVNSYIIMMKVQKLHAYMHMVLMMHECWLFH